MTHDTGTIPPPALCLGAETPASIAAPVPIRLPNGLPGFPGETDYVLEPVATTDGRFFRLRAAQGVGPAFLLTADTGPAPLVDRDEVAPAAEASGLEAEEVVILLVVAAAREGGGLHLFVNRRAPILIDARRQLAAQVVLARPDYAVRHRLGASRYAA